MKCQIDIICIICVFIFIACNRDKSIKSKYISAYPIEIDLTDNEQKQSVSLSQIADSITYIRLETDSTIYLSTVVGLQMNNDFIYVKVQGQVYRFSTDGSYISEVNRVGKGPGEGYARCFTVNSQNNDVLIFNNYTGKIMQYNKNNDFYRYLKASDDKAHSIETMYYYNENLLMGIRSYPNIKYFAKVYNLKNDSTYIGLSNGYSVDDKINFKGIGFNTKSIFFNTINDTLLIKETFCDTIFSTSNLKTFSPRYIIKLGHNKISYNDDLLVRTREKKRKGTNVVADNFCETSRYLFILYDITKEKDRFRQLIIYDKRKDKIYCQKDLNIENDLDSGLDFSAFGLLGGIWSYNNKIYCLLYPNDIKAEAGKYEQRNTHGTDSFMKLTHDIDSNDNPVLMLVKLK